MFKKSARYSLSLLVVLVLNFTLPRAMPGDPVMHLMGAEDYYRFPDMAEQVRARHGLDRSLVAQAWTYVVGLSRGDLGVSFRYRSDVGELLLRGLKWTAYLVLPSLAVGAALAALLGGVAGWCRGRPWERLLTMGIMLFRSVPEYGIAMIALLVLAYHLALFPIAGISQVGGLEILRHALLPWIILSLLYTCQYYLVLRNAIAATRAKPFIVSARARGLTSRVVLQRHAFREAALPFLSLLGLGLGFSVSGALLVEIVFSWPGMGSLILSAVNSRDYPLLQGCFLVLTASVLLVNYLTDLAYGFCDPRLRVGT